MIKLEPCLTGRERPKTVGYRAYATTQITDVVSHSQSPATRDYHRRMTSLARQPLRARLRMTTFINNFLPLGV